MRFTSLKGANKVSAVLTALALSLALSLSAVSPAFALPSDALPTLPADWVDQIDALNSDVSPVCLDTAASSVVYGHIPGDQYIMGSFYEANGGDFLFCLNNQTMTYDAPNNIFNFYGTTGFLMYKNVAGTFSLYRNATTGANPAQIVFDQIRGYNDTLSIPDTENKFDPYSGSRSVDPGIHFATATPPPTCDNGATDYPTCTPPTCTNGATDYPTCTPPNNGGGGGGTTGGDTDITQRDVKLISLGLATLIAYLLIKPFRWRGND